MLGAVSKLLYQSVVDLTLQENGTIITFRKYASRAIDITDSHFRILLVINVMNVHVIMNVQVIFKSSKRTSWLYEPWTFIYEYLIDFQENTVFCYNLAYINIFQVWCGILLWRSMHKVAWIWHFQVMFWYSSKGMVV